MNLYQLIALLAFIAGALGAIALGKPELAFTLGGAAAGMVAPAAATAAAKHAPPAATLITWPALGAAAGGALWYAIGG